MKNSGIFGYVNGIQNEKEIMEALDGKSFKELSDHLKKVVQTMFRDIKDDDVIHAEKVPGFAKPDLKISVNDEKHYLSIKFGSSSSLHCEQLEVLINWLSDHGIDDETIDNLLLYHYGDGTRDGSGQRRMPQQEVLRVYSKEVEQLNLKLNSNRFFVRDFVKRVVFDGNDPFKPSADFIYHGDIEEGEICSKEAMLAYCKRKTFHRLINVHIGPVMIRPYARYTSGVETYPEKRQKVAFEWSRIGWDIMYINKWKF